MTRTRNKTLLIAAAATATTAILGGMSLAGTALAADTANGAGGDKTGLPATSPESSPSVSASPSTSPSIPSSPAVSPSASATCSTVDGDPAAVGGPGVGAVTVTLTTCADTISSVSSKLSESNYAKNKKALVAMDKLALTYAKTDINLIAYSGATYTAESYRASLKSALVKAGLRPAVVHAGA